MWPSWVSMIWEGSYYNSMVDQEKFDSLLPKLHINTWSTVEQQGKYCQKKEEKKKSKEIDRLLW